VAHARASMPRFAMPRYLEFRTSLPKTGTEKVRKNELKALGVTQSTIDLQGLY
jgi:crotonobetaine/carnitine-CoA ligase